MLGGRQRLDPARGWASATTAIAAPGGATIPLADYGQKPDWEKLPAAIGGAAT